MERIVQPMFRYGEADFDKGYIEWGLHDKATRVEEAESVLRLIPAGRPLKILDLACGVGTHAIYWAKQGHQVTAVDISATFVEEGSKRAEEQSVSVTFEVGDIKQLPYRDCFDVVTWVEKSFFDDEVIQAIHSYLTDTGVFIFDDRNPEHPKAKRVTGNWRTWREENGIFYLERHETDEVTGMHHDVWIEIDTNTDKIIEKPQIYKKTTIDDRINMLRTNGFSNVESRTMSGDLFTGGEEPYWLWTIARKG